MIPKGFITQIGMIAVAVGIFLTYIQPTLVEVQVQQDEIATMRDQREKVVLVNNKLSSLVARAESIDSIKYKKLLTYLPREVDVVAVQRDILAIANEAGVELIELSSEKLDANRNSAPAVVSTEPGLSQLKKHTFTVGFNDSYEKIKQFLSLIERNDYPLHVAELKVSTVVVTEGEQGLLSTSGLPVSLTLETFSFALSSSTVAVE